MLYCPQYHKWRESALPMRTMDLGMAVMKPAAEKKDARKKALCQAGKHTDPLDCSFCA